MESEDVLLDVLRRRFGLRPWMPIVMAEIIGEKIAEALKIPAPKISIPQISIPQPSTRVVDWRDMLVSSDLILLDVSVGGRLHELVLCSNSSNYSIRIVTDGMVRLDRSFRELQSISPYLDSIDAIEDNGRFILYIKDYSWLNSVYAIVRIREPIMFSQVFIKYDVYS